MGGLEPGKTVVCTQTDRGCGSVKVTANIFQPQSSSDADDCMNNGTSGRTLLRSEQVDCTREI